KPLRDAARAAEQALDRLHREKQALEAALADPAVYEKSPGRVPETTRRLADVARRLVEAEQAWMQAQSALEQGIIPES
ncbi:MAG: ABC transporter ATP-binding protein, partial [Rhodospirillales bacterium]